MDRELARAEVRLQTPHRHGARRRTGCEGGKGEGQFILIPYHKDFMIKLLQVGDINRQMWQQVNKHKSILPYPHQISFMVDRTVEHFKVQLQKKMKKKAQEAAKAAAASGSSAGGDTPREVRNLPKAKKDKMYPSLQDKVREGSPTIRITQHNIVNRGRLRLRNRPKRCRRSCPRPRRSRARPLRRRQRQRRWL